MKMTRFKKTIFSLSEKVSTLHCPEKPAPFCRQTFQNLVDKHFKILIELNLSFFVFFYLLFVNFLSFDLIHRAKDLQILMIRVIAH
jgi:hypothetical protein